MTSIRKEPSPYDHHYLNALIHILINIDGQTFSDHCFTDKLVGLCKQFLITSFIGEKAETYDLDDATKAIIKIFLDFKAKCDELEETKNEDLKFLPVLPTAEALTAIQGEGTNF